MKLNTVSLRISFFLPFDELVGGLTLCLVMRLPQQAAQFAIVLFRASYANTARYHTVPLSRLLNLNNRKVTCN